MLRQLTPGLTLTSLSGPQMLACLDSAHRRGARGGAIYDLLILEAARLAKQHGAALIYVYAVDLAFLKGGKMGSLSQDVIAQSIEKLGAAVLTPVINKNDLPIFRKVPVHDGLNFFKKRP